MFVRDHMHQVILFSLAIQKYKPRTPHMSQFSWDHYKSQYWIRCAKPVGSQARTQEPSQGEHIFLGGVHSLWRWLYFHAAGIIDKILRCSSDWSTGSLQVAVTSAGLSWETAVENQAFILSPPSKSISLQTCEVKPKGASYPMITQKWFRQDQRQKFPSHAKLTYSVAFLPHRNENLKIWNFS